MGLVCSVCWRVRSKHFGGETETVYLAARARLTKSLLPCLDYEVLAELFWVKSGDGCDSLECSSDSCKSTKKGLAELRA